MHIRQIFTAAPAELASGEPFKDLPTPWHEPIVTAVELRHRYRSSCDLDLSLESGRELDKLIRAALRAKPKRVARLVRAIGCYASAMLIEHCDAEFVALGSTPILLRVAASNAQLSPVYTSGIRLAIDAWESGKPRIFEAIQGLVDHLDGGAERPSLVPFYDLDSTERLRHVWLYAQSLQAVFGRFEQERWNLVNTPQTLGALDDILGGNLDRVLAIRLGTVSTNIDGLSAWQADASAAFFGELVREHLGGRWIQPERGPVEMDIQRDDTVFSPRELCRRAVAREGGRYPLLNAYQALMDYVASPGSTFPLEDVQVPPDPEEDDHGIEATQAWSIAALAAGAPSAGTAGPGDELETREVVSPSSHSHIAVRDDLGELTQPTDVAALKAGLVAPEPGGSTREYDINELQRALVNAAPSTPESSTKQFDGAALAEAFQRRGTPTPAKADDDGDSTRQYRTDELMRGLGDAIRTSERASAASRDEAAGMSTREYDAATLAQGMSGRDGGLAPPPDPFAHPQVSDPFAGLMDESIDSVDVDIDVDSVDVEIDASFDADDLYEQMLDDPDFGGSGPRLPLSADSGPASAVIQTLAEWTDEHDSPVTAPLNAVVGTGTSSDATQDVGDYLPELAKLTGRGTNSKLAEVAAQLMPVLVPHDWERQRQVASEHLVGGSPSSPLVTVAVDHPDKLIYVNHSDIRDWESSFTHLRSLALNNLARVSSGLTAQFSEVDLGPEPIYQLSTGDYFEASRVLLHTLSDVGHHLVGTRKLWVALPNRNILLLTAAGSQKQLRALAEVTRFCFQEKEFSLTPDVFLYGAPGPAIQRIVKV